MKRYSAILTTVTIALLFTACGGGGGGEKTTTNGAQERIYSGSIDLWQYMVPNADRTNSYIKTTGSNSQQYQTRYVVKENSVTEESELSSNEKTVYTNKGNTILVTFFTDGAQNGSVELKAKVDIGNIVTVKKSDCRLTRQLAEYSYNGQNFKDVIEIVCGKDPGYYQRGVGEILQKKTLTTNGQVETKILTKQK
jgi:hypothetical protein